MNTLIKVPVILLMLIMAWSLTGCHEPYAQKKQEMIKEWEKSTVQAKLATVEGLIDHGELEKAKKTLKQCLEAAPESPRVHLLIGRIQFMEGRTEDARRSFHEAVRMDPELAQGWHLLGSLAIVDRDYDQALELYKKALELQPANTDYLISVSSIYVEMNQVEQAREMIEEQLSQQADDLKLMLELAHLYQQSGDMSGAVRIYEQAQLIHGDLPQILEASAFAYMTMGKWDQASEKLELLLEYYKQDQEHYNVTLRSLAMASFNAENYARAMSCYDELSIIYREDPDIWLGMAQSALALDDAERTIYCAGKAIQYRPGWAKAHTVLGGALYVKGDYERALDSFLKITGNDEYAAFAWFMTGRCYRQLGHAVQAEAAFQKAEQLDPDNELIRKYLKKTLKFL